MSSSTSFPLSFSDHPIQGSICSFSFSHHSAWTLHHRHGFYTAERFGFITFGVMNSYLLQHPRATAVFFLGLNGVAMSWRVNLCTGHAFESPSLPFYTADCYISMVHLQKGLGVQLQSTTETVSKFIHCFGNLILLLLCYTSAIVLGNHCRQTPQVS